MAYIKDVDYQKLINESVAQGDYAAAGAYERARNEKIQAEGLDYAPTNYFQTPTSTTMGSGSDKKESPRDWVGNYKGQYSKEMDELLGKIMNREPFSYDLMSDPLYANYKDTYKREGQRAMQDAIGNVSARTGGLASSYAASAGAQANQYYMQKLADKIPELSQLAYSMYDADYNRDLQKLGLLKNLDDSLYGRYRDDVGDAYRNREFDYNASRDQVADNRYNAEIAYRDRRDQISDARYDDETQYNRSQDSLNRAAQENATAFDEAMTVWQVLGYLPEKYAETLGIPAGTKTSDYYFTQAQMALRQAKSGGSSGGGSSRGRKSSSSKSKSTKEDAAEQSGSNFDGIDQSSVLALGLGPISADSLFDLVDQGQVSYTIGADGKASVFWNPEYRRGAPFVPISALNV